MLLLFVVAFALIVVGAAVINGTAVLRRLLIVIPTVFLVTAFTFFLQNGRGNRHDLAFNLLGPGATESGVAQIVRQVPLGRAAAPALHAVAERCRARRPRQVTDLRAVGRDGDRPGASRCRCS